MFESSNTMEQKGHFKLWLMKTPPELPLEFLGGRLPRASFSSVLYVLPVAPGGFLFLA